MKASHAQILQRGFGGYAATGAAVALWGAIEDSRPLVSGGAVMTAIGYVGCLLLTQLTPPRRRRP